MAYLSNSSPKTVTEQMGWYKMPPFAMITPAHSSLEDFSYLPSAKIRRRILATIVDASVYGALATLRGAIIEGIFEYIRTHFLLTALKDSEKVSNLIHGNFNSSDLTLEQMPEEIKVFLISWKFRNMATFETPIQGSRRNYGINK